MFKGKRVSLVFPAYNEEENIGAAVRGFKKLGVFDEIIVVDNNSNDKTAKLASRAGAKVVGEKKQGYGFAIRKGMKVAKGEYVVLAEPDGTFFPQDAFKLLRRLDGVDFVIGTRTNPKFIQKKANMGFFLRHGNISLAKLIQILFRTSAMSDCGCTFRVFKRQVVLKMISHLKVGGSYMLPETVIVPKKLGFKFLEVPVVYRRRVGKSKITGSKVKTVKVGLLMLVLVLEHRFFAKLYSR